MEDLQSQQVNSIVAYSICSYFPAKHVQQEHDSRLLARDVGSGRKT